MDYYKNIKPWKLNGERVDVVEDNDHLGLVVSGINEEQKNIDQNISQNPQFSVRSPRTCSLIQVQAVPNCTDPHLENLRTSYLDVWSCSPSHTSSSNALSQNLSEQNIERVSQAKLLLSCCKLVLPMW